MLRSTANLLRTNQSNNNYLPVVICSRYGHTLRGKKPGVALSLEERLKREKSEDEMIAPKTNIGFPSLRYKRSEELKKRLAHLKKLRNDPTLEKKARHHNLEINLNEVRNDYMNVNGPYHLSQIAAHYGIYRDLYGNAWFTPRVNLNIMYNISDDLSTFVRNGNTITPTEAALPPSVTFNDKSLNNVEREPSENKWTLIMTNLDAHIAAEKGETVHWLLTNIKENKIETGEVIVPYMQPFPAKGLGYQRFVFVLYKQKEPLDLSKYKVTRANNLEERAFSTSTFYKSYEDVITPAGLSFFQSSWDKNLKIFYHNVLGIKEPIYEYDFPAPYLAEQEWFPLKKPFDLYLDKYRSEKEIYQEYLENKLKKTEPFEAPEPPLRFPMAHPLRNIPSWLKTRIKKDRLRTILNGT